MKSITFSDPEQAKEDARHCMQIIEDANKELGGNEFLNGLEIKMRKLLDDVEKL